MLILLPWWLNLHASASDSLKFVTSSSPSLLSILHVHYTVKTEVGGAKTNAVVECGTTAHWLSHLPEIDNITLRNTGRSLERACYLFVVPHTSQLACTIRLCTWYAGNADIKKSGTPVHDHDDGSINIARQSKNNSKAGTQHTAPHVHACVYTIHTLFIMCAGIDFERVNSNQRLRKLYRLYVSCNSSVPSNVCVSVTQKLKKIYQIS